MADADRAPIPPRAEIVRQREALDVPSMHLLATMTEAAARDQLVIIPCYDADAGRVVLVLAALTTSDGTNGRVHATMVPLARLYDTPPGDALLMLDRHGIAPRQSMKHGVETRGGADLLDLLQSQHDRPRDGA